MQKFLTILLGLVVTLFFLGCDEQLQIQGSTHIYINEVQPYKASLLTETSDGLSDFKWKVKSKNKDYTLTNSDSAEITFNAQSVGSYTLQVKAKKGHKPLKAEIHIEVTEPEVINGYTLPSEPDKTLNDSTLLGIDVNNNGVRDDVERWIYQTYKDKHPIYIDIALQESKANKKILETPEKALEIHDEVNKATDCQAYYKYSAKYYNEPILIQEDAVDEHFRNKIYFNTEERKNMYSQYEKLLSGGVYSLAKDEEQKAACDFNTSKYEE